MWPTILSDAKDKLNIVFASFSLLIIFHNNRKEFEFKILIFTNNYKQLFATTSTSFGLDFHLQTQQRLLSQKLYLNVAANNHFSSDFRMSPLLSVSYRLKGVAQW